MKSQLFKILALSFLVLSGFQAVAQDPVVTVRFANPKYVCSTQTYSLDVQFQCNIANKELFGMNVRFFYADNVLEFLSFGEFVEGYGPVSPNPPTITTGNSSSGMTLFGFPGSSEYVNGAIQKYSQTPYTYLSTTGWTKLFNVSFHVDDPNAPDTNSFCPSVIWDLNEAANGGINPNGGIIITLVVTYPGVTSNAVEHCIQFNWQYDGIPGGPAGYPVNTNCISTLRTYAPATTLPTCGYDIPGLINIPVTVTNFTSIGAFSLVFEYDPVVMTYVNNTSNAIFTSANGLLNVFDSVSTGGKRKIKMNYQRQENHAISLGDGAHMTDLHFNYISGSTDLTWKTSGNSCHYADSNLVTKCDQPYSSFYINGMVVSSLAPITKIDSNVAIAGDYVTYSVRVWNFINIHSGLLTLNYDPDILVYFDSAPNAAIAGYFEAGTISPGTLEMGWTGNDTSLTDGSILMYLTFEYLGGAAPLFWFDDGGSCQYFNSNLSLPLTDEPAEDYYVNGNIASASIIWTGNISSDWNSGANWIDDIIPNRFIDVTLDPSSNPLYWPTYTGNFTLGENCKNLTLNGNSGLTVTGDLTINPGHTLNVTGSELLQIGGNWTNLGIFNPGSGTVEFTGTGDGTIAEGVPPDDYVAGFMLTTFTTGMTPITGGSAGPAGDNAHSDVNIGFEFDYLGINYTQVRINTNGWLSFNLTGDDATSSDNTHLFNSSVPTTALAPWWDDLKTDGSTAITYLTEGLTPNRVFTVEWKNILAYSSVTAAQLSFQVKLYETTNIIEFCYGNVSNGTHNAAESASIGIKGATGGPGNFVEATQNTMNLFLAFLNSEVDWPADNYRFLPPAENTMDVFYELFISKVPGQLYIQRDVKVTGIN